MADFNVPPYFDDYDEAKGYYKILFRPSVAVQTRELNQLQTMVQKQIERFGSHIFKEGSIVVGGGFDVETDVPYVRATSVSSNQRLQEFVGKIVRGGSSGITAYVKAVEFDTSNNVYAFMLRYTSASTTTTVFLNDETVTVVSDSTLSFVVSASAATGIGSTFGLQSGVVFSKGYFVAFPTSTIILEKYSTTPSATVGITTTESFVTELSDSSLLDNSLGSPNENAPGAHRYKINTTLIKLAYKEGYDDPTFIPLVDIQNGFIETKKERPEYSKLLDELAKRTFDESGDYLVNGFGVRTREHLDTGVNEGLYTSSNGGNPNKLSIDVEPGVAYVKGYEVSNLVTRHVETDKAITFEYVNNQQVNARTGGYFLIKEIVGSLGHDTGLVVNLYNAAETRITSKKRNDTALTASNLKIGEARLKALVYDSGTLGTPTGYMRAYMFDFVMNAGYVISDVRAIQYGTSPDQFFADVANADDADGANLLDDNQNDLLFDLGSKHIRSIRSNTGSSDTSFQFNRTETKTASLNSSSALTASVTTVGETLAYSTGELSSAEKRELILSINADSNVALTGTVTGTATQYTLTGSGTSFNNLSVGDRIAFALNSQEYYVNSIISSTSLTLKTAIVNSIDANTYVKALRKGDIIDLTANGSSGAQRTATVSSGSLVIDLKEVATANPSSVATRLTYRVNRNTAVEMKKRLRPNRLVKIDRNTNVAGSVGPYNLGLSDVYKIRSIRMRGSPFDAVTDGTDVTSSFTLDNGQRDNLYDHARIIYTGTSSLSRYLLVELDHFEKDETQGFGYFSVDSYPIDDTAVSNATIFTYEIPVYTSTYGVEYDLRNVFDYRPYKTSTATSTTSIGSATTNPATTSSLSVDGDGLRMVAPDSDINLDYSFYLARRDLVTIDRFGELSVIKGEPSISPTSPKGSDNVASLARVYIPPYPSVSETLSRQLNKRGIGCISKKILTPRYTMREIGTLKERVDTLEYYNALNLLEKSVVDLKVLDSGGLNRFKNGFFVDNFLDHSLGDTKNPDYKIAVDKSEKTIRPFFELDSFQYKLEDAASSGYKLSGSLITRPFTQKVLLENKNVTTIRNIEQSVFRFIGTIELNPETDNWVDTKTVDKTIKFGEDLPASDSINTEWGSWENNIVGYSVYDRKTGDRSGVPDPKYFIGTFSTLAEAMAAGRDHDPANSGDNRFLVETIYERSREGIQTTVNSETEIENIGNFVTDVSIKTYIRSQEINLLVRGLKPNTKVYTFFDGEDMSDYVSPITVPAAGIPSSFLEDLTPNYDSESRQTPKGLIVGNEGSTWRVNDVGVAMAYLRLPKTGKLFRTGTKEIIITDSPTNAIDATTYAKTYFVASGIAVTKQNTIISTRTAVINTEETIQTLPTKGQTEIVGPSCMAYSFKVDVPKGEDGIFLTDVDLWVDQKDEDLGIWFEIREMNSAGGITRNQVPFSEVWLTPEQVKLWDGKPGTEESRSTRVTFPSPVFLQNDTQYAFVIHTEGLNPNYYFWVSRLGETDILSGNQVTSRQLTGTLFTTNNNLNYDMVPDVDLKIRFIRAEFATGAGTVVFGNKPVEFVNLKAGASTFKRGEPVISTDIIRVSDRTFGANSIVVGDKITGATSLVTGNVTLIGTTSSSASGPRYFTDVFDGYIDGETYSVANSTGGNKSITGTITRIDFGLGKIRSYNESNNILIIDDSNGLFYTDAKIKGLRTSNTAEIATFDTFDYSTSTLKPYYIKFGKTDISFEKRGWDVSLNSYTNYIPGSPDAQSDFPTECAVLSRRSEILLFDSQKDSSTSQVKVTLSTGSQYVSPVLDISRMQSILVYNTLNNDDTGEDQPSGGNLLNKYISKPVTLADGQDAEDLLVKLTAYKPINSDVKVWMKIRSREDGAKIAQNPWIEMSTNNRATSSSVNKQNFKELDFTVPENYKNVSGVIQYIKNATNITANTTGVNEAANSILIASASSIFTADQKVYYSVPPGGTPIAGLTANTYYFVKTVNSTAITLSETKSGSQIDITDFRVDPIAQIHTIGGEVYETYKNFSIKIGLMGTDTSNPPRVGDLRALALQL
jgi:hypothetical protein